MIKLSSYIYMLFFGYLLSIDFIIQNHSTTINVEGQSLMQPFTGGNNYARISWIDWDNDGDTDLFVLDEDLHFRYFKNDGTFSNSDFILTHPPETEPEKSPLSLTIILLPTCLGDEPHV